MKSHLVFDTYSACKAYLSKKYEKYDKSFIEQVEGRSTNPRMLIAGNGLSRLAMKDKDYSWKSWIEDVWKDIDPLFSFDYAMERRMTLPECIDYLRERAKEIDKAEGDGNERATERMLIEKLWEVTELSEPVNVHNKCLESFDIIVTTNYDTLFERAAIKNPTLNTSVHVIDNRKRPKRAFLFWKW